MRRSCCEIPSRVRSAVFKIAPVSWHPIAPIGLNDATCWFPVCVRVLTGMVWSDGGGVYVDGVHDREIPFWCYHVVSCVGVNRPLGQC